MSLGGAERSSERFRKQKVAPNAREERRFLQTDPVAMRKMRRRRGVGADMFQGEQKRWWVQSLVVVDPEPSGHHHRAHGSPARLATLCVMSSALDWLRFELYLQPQLRSLRLSLCTVPTPLPLKAFIMRQTLARRVINPTYLARNSRSCMLSVPSRVRRPGPNVVWTAANLDEAKRRVIGSYREWIRAVRDIRMRRTSKTADTRNHRLPRYNSSTP